MKKYTVLGFNEEICECDICGKSELKGTYALLDNETGDIIRAGSSCGAKAAACTVKELNANLKAVEAAERLNAAKKELQSLPEFARFNELKDATDKFSKIIANGLHLYLNNMQYKIFKKYKVNETQIISFND